MENAPHLLLLCENLSSDSGFSENINDNSRIKKDSIFLIEYKEKKNILAKSIKLKKYEIIKDASKNTLNHSFSNNATNNSNINIMDNVNITSSVNSSKSGKFTRNTFKLCNIPVSHYQLKNTPSNKKKRWKKCKSNESLHSLDVASNQNTTISCLSCCFTSAIKKPIEKSESLNDKIKNKSDHIYHSMPNFTKNVESWKRCLENILVDAIGINLFRKYLESEYSDENLHFYLAVEQFKRVDEVHIPKMANKIFNQFISVLSEREISVDAKCRNEINESLTNPTREMYNNCQLQVLMLMKRDSYMRFLNSSIFFDFIRHQISIKKNNG
ncbi:hypothetical protein A3Q56_00021 [Intoshia linei]|uniref:RGS domain-containing protein n=1 Tax=Intoshia linei TaxID=1819745 RepID=A0A177BDA9_9BILA|nr:hypothetical protein A3Q56_00021 [Intoshia linei]